MIGVIADSADHDVVREFFELFKTPWEFYRRDRRYEVVLCAADSRVDEEAQLVIVYGGRRVQSDQEQIIHSDSRPTSFRILSYRGRRIPIYGDRVTFPETGNDVLRDEYSQECAGYLQQSGEKVLARIGYDLFGEVRTLLTAGQPSANADIPALELHIGILRDLITGCGMPLAEIPPVPDGYGFIACLTHDVDHPSIRQHKWDHTTFGFLYRATVGSLSKLARGRISLRTLLTNWAAALKLPLVHLGLARDFWREFDDCYLELEKGLPSTFFMIPFKNHPGRTSQGPAPEFRAAAYGAQDIADSITKILAAGGEIGLHGIDAWLDDSKGQEELKELRRLTGVSEIGVRMHWLYYDQQSPVVLEKADAAYDATAGYNDTVGYRSGTTQAYKPLGATRLLELPLHVMDTAMFYPAYLGLSPRQAGTTLKRFADNAACFGGCLTINWHDRSVVPERLWVDCYRDLIQELKSRDAWFATGGQATSWFRKRRSVVFESDSREPGGVRARVSMKDAMDLPGLRLRIHQPRKCKATGSEDSEAFVDIELDESADMRVPCGANE
jgi:hypothetical protein